MIFLFTQIAAFALSGAPVARADVLIEPFGSYHLGQSRQSGTTDADHKMTTYGARIGYRGAGFMTGVEYLRGEGTEDESKAKLSPTNMGVFVGYTLPVLLRVYGVYSFDAKLDRTVTNVTDSYTDGTAIKAGVGITSLSLVALNIEYIASTYNRVNNVPVAHKYLTSGYGLSVGFPFAF